MNCPYCNKEMESGFIKSSHFIHWGKERELGFLPNDIKLTKTNLEAFMKGHFVEAYYCTTCNKIIVSVENK